MADVFVITGLDDAVSDLSALPEAIVREFFPDALAAGGEVMRGELAARTPQSEGSSSAKEYGSLRDDLDVEVDVGTLEGSAKAGFGDKGYVARFVEYGHRELTHDRKEVGNVQPHPFMGPASHAAEDASVEAFSVSLASQK